MHFEVFRGANGEHRFRLVADNEKIVAQSEGYERRQDALDTIEAIRFDAEAAEIVEVDE